MEVVGLCIYSGITLLKVDSVYQISINEEDETFKVSSEIIGEGDIIEKPLSVLNIYFKIYQNKENTKMIFKDKLNITDEDIIEYYEANNYERKNVLCIRYKHDFIYLYFNSNDDTNIKINITSNNLARQKTIQFDLFEDDIIKICELIKFLQK